MKLRTSGLVRALTTGLLVAGLGLAGAALPGTAAQAAPTRADIVEIARGEVGVSEASGECNRYGPCREYAWCAMFVEWVWKRAGVSPVPTTWVARGVGAWGAERGLFHRNNPQPGDLVIYGEPGYVTGGHVSIVAAVNSNGTINTIDGNFGDKVTRRTDLDPDTARAVASNLRISGYVTPPNLGTAPPPPPPPPSGWSNVVRADLDGDGDDEFGFYRNNDGRLGWYEMGAAGGLGSGLASYDISVNWDEIVGGDLDGDGDDEALFYRQSDGRLQAYELSPDGHLGTALASYDISPTWTEITAADLDGNGDDEALFYRINDGRLQTHQLSPDGHLGGEALSNYEVSATWEEIVDADLDGDGDDEVLFYRQSDGHIQAHEMSPDGHLGGEALSSWDASTTWTELVSGDLDGNGNDETGFYRNTDGQFNIYQMTTTGHLGERLNQLDLYP
jgi:hypothetical protein